MVIQRTGRANLPLAICFGVVGFYFLLGIVRAMTADVPVADFSFILERETGAPGSDNWQEVTNKVGGSITAIPLSEVGGNYRIRGRASSDATKGSYEVFAVGANGLRVRIGKFHIEGTNTNPESAITMSTIANHVKNGQLDVPVKIQIDDIGDLVPRDTSIGIAIPNPKISTPVLPTQSRITLVNSKDNPYENDRPLDSDIIGYRLNSANFDDLNLKHNGVFTKPGIMTIMLDDSEILDHFLMTPNSSDTIALPADRFRLYSDRVLPFKVFWTDESGTKLVGKNLNILWDTVGPHLEVVRTTVVQYPPQSENTSPLANVTLELDFAANDLDPDSVKDKGNYQIERIDESGRFIRVGDKLASASLHPTNKRIVVLKYNGLAEGVYRLRIAGEGTAADNPLQDVVGNLVGAQSTLKISTAAQESIFGINPQAERGQQIQFPEFLPTAPQPNTVRRINPGDKVETAVVRLFYFRDAHRVAQLINRTAESLNRQAVTLAEQRAADARRQADDLTEDRQAAEREAVRDAEALREMENEAQVLATEYNRQEQEVRRLRIQKSQTPPPAPTEEGATAGPSPLDSALSTAETALNTLATAYNDMQSSIETKRTQAAKTNEKAIALQAKEDRARAEQFRMEVAAANADPDTYAAAQKDSVDSVAQCSVSVIGEGVLQIRGPRKGIDKIRTMVHQIDMPLGQVKVEIATVQLNGERADRMEKPLGRVEAHLGMGRFLTAQSLMLLRQAIVEEAAQVAMQAEQGSHYQVDRDRKYLYSFFGRDFVDELYAMDSEFLDSENKLLGLHSMDTTSLHQSLFILALARNDVRARILQNFMFKVRNQLVQAEFDYRRSAEIFPHRTHNWLPHHTTPHIDEKVLRGVCVNNVERYHFRNFLNFFATNGMLPMGADGICLPNSGEQVEFVSYENAQTMNPVQREFIRLAQVFKARLISEMELKQRVIERAMIEDARELDLQAEEQATNAIRPMVLESVTAVQTHRFEMSKTLGEQRINGQKLLQEQLTEIHAALASAKINPLMIYELNKKSPIAEAALAVGMADEETYAKSVQSFKKVVSEYAKYTQPLRRSAEKIAPTEGNPYVDARDRLIEILDQAEPLILAANGLNIDNFGKNEQELSSLGEKAGRAAGLVQMLINLKPRLWDYYEFEQQYWSQEVEAEFRKFLQMASPLTLETPKDFQEINSQFVLVRNLLRRAADSNTKSKLIEAAHSIIQSVNRLQLVVEQRTTANQFLRETRRSLQHRKLLDFFIEEQEEKVIDLLEGTRSHIAQLDNYLKRLMIALEDDFNLQFYEPAFVRIRSAATQWDVTLGQVERTSILTNNRALAKVTPQATMEFDLPKRNIAIVEAFDGAKALLQDYGALANDPTFLAAAQLMGAQQPNGLVQNLYPSLPTNGEEARLNLSNPVPNQSGSALQNLVPDPSIYKFETGTGYEIRPVIQPDGHSIVYDFNYMYTTNVREPVQADEKHLGRIKRHYINTQVQTSSFELRLISRYQVTLKAARTSQGVPLLQDIPGVGMAFRPLPSDESSIQQNIILGQTVVYPTLFDLMGLRWAPSVVDLNHTSTREAEHIVRGRFNSVKNSIDEISKRRFDDLIGIPHETPQHHRPDLYHRNELPSPYHPGGYRYPAMKPEDDPTGRGFEHRDRRPVPEFAEPPYDPRYGFPIRPEQAYGEGTLQVAPEVINNGVELVPSQIEPAIQ